jgi:hypothetical protein
MGKAIYGCTNCRKTFSRKYNAERHNTYIHNEMAVIYNKENNWVSKKRKIGNVATSTVGATPISTIATENSSMDNNNKTSKKEIPQNSNFNFKDFARNSKENSGDDTNVDNKLDKFLKFIEKLMPLVIELDTLLTSYKKPGERIKIVSDAIIQSLIAHDPFISIKEKISFHRTEFGLLKAYGYIALSENTSPQQAEKKLKLLVWNSPYFKRNLASSVY